MIILHCMPEAVWESVRTLPRFGEASVAAEGFVHCSSIEFFWRVAPNFLHETEPLVLLLIDTDRVPAEILWEDADHCGRAYPHVYGMIPTDAVTGVLPFLRDKAGNWLKNPELAGHSDL